MTVALRKAQQADLPLIHSMQVSAFMPILEKYHDYDLSPAAEGKERIAERFEQPFTVYWLIMAEGQPVGAMRVCDFGERCRVSPIFVLPEHHGHGYGQQAMVLAEEIYTDASVWELDTILQEPGLCRMYERLGYKPTGKTEHIKDGMDIVFYEKKIR